MAYLVSSQTLWIEVGEHRTTQTPSQPCALSPFLKLGGLSAFGNMMLSNSW